MVSPNPKDFIENVGTLPIVRHDVKHITTHAPRPLGFPKLLLALPDCAVFPRDDGQGPQHHKEQQEGKPIKGSDDEGSVALVETRFLVQHLRN